MKDYEAKWPKATEKVTKDREELLAFFDFPAEHWVHLKTTNPIESTFATVRLRTKVTKGPGSRAAGLAMAYKLIESAQTRWRAINAPAPRRPRPRRCRLREGGDGRTIRASWTRRSPRNRSDSHPQVLTISRLVWPARRADLAASAIEPQLTAVGGPAGYQVGLPCPLGLAHM